jgi:ProP effector
LRIYVGAPGYLLACTEGAARIDLEGREAGTVTAAEAVHAREMLVRRAANKARRGTRANQAAPAPIVTPAVKRDGLAALRAAARARKAAMTAEVENRRA